MVGMRRPDDDHPPQFAGKRRSGIQNGPGRAHSRRDEPADPAALLMDLTPAQRERIQQVLEDELRAASRSAMDRGAHPADVRETFTSRRRALDRLLLDLADDSEHPLDDPGDGCGLGE
jgi:hypothetical protein